MVFDPEGYVLALRRGPTAPWMPSHWNFPGGYVEEGEAIPAAATRELAEEAGICLDPSALNYAFSFRDRVLAHVFWVVLPQRVPVVSYDNEHDAYTWARPDQIPQPVIPRLPFMMRQLLQAAV
jgi:8-oxo-dGTP pyrophosphatase MutT (NUDIX family)